MDQPEEELEQIAAWLSEEGLAPDSPKEVQLSLLWRALQRTRSCLSSVTRDQDKQRSQHRAEMAEVRKSLEQIRIFTEHKDVLAQEIQDENDALKDQLRQLISLQDTQTSEVAKMLYQQGLTELIHSSPSEQVAYLLVERASLLETSEDSDNLKGARIASRPQGTETQMPNSNAQKAETTHLTGQSSCQSSSLERKCSHLERDVEEGSRRLAMAHNEIRRLTDELESAHLTQKAYEPELMAAHQEVENLKKYKMVEVRKAKELNDRLDLEIRALRSRVRSLDAERSSLQQTVLSLREEMEQLESALQEQQQQQLLTVHVQAEQATQLAKVVSPQKEVARLESALQEQQQHVDQQLQAVQFQADQANELTKIHSLKKHWETTHEDPDNLIATVCKNENNQDQKLWKQKEADLQHCEKPHWQLDNSLTTWTKELEECPDYKEGVRTLVSTQDECETLKREICETLKCLDKERSKYHEMKEKHKVRLCRAKDKFDDETGWRDEKIKSLERELSLCSHSLSKEKELVQSINAGNEKLLVERTRLLQQLNEEEDNKKNRNLTTALSKYRMDFLEMENKKMGNKIFHMSSQLAVLERTLQNMQSLHFAKEIKRIYNPHQIFTSLCVQTSSVMMPEPPEIQTLLDDTQSDHTKQTDATSSPHGVICTALSQSAEMGYLNLTSTQSLSEHSTPPHAQGSSESFSS